MTIASMQVLPDAWRSFFIAGFDCTSMRRFDGNQLDLLASTKHDQCARQDFEQIARYGIRAARDGLRWHRIETRRGVYDWQTWLPMLRAARATGLHVTWDLCHYGWPDAIDIWSGEFVDAFARFSKAAAKLARDESDDVPYYCPINEMSFWAWAGGHVGRIGPLAIDRAMELKRQLVRAYIASVEAIREVDPRARFLAAEPLIHVASQSDESMAVDAAERYRVAQFEVHDMLIGALHPDLGGAQRFLDIVGVNYYPDNQWYLGGSTIPLGHHAYRPFVAMLREVYARYNRAILVSETGAEGSARPYWLHHVCAQARLAIQDRVPVLGICLYPIVDYPGWENDRLCEAGLLSMPNSYGLRVPEMEFLGELFRQASLVDDTELRRYV